MISQNEIMSIISIFDKIISLIRKNELSTAAELYNSQLEIRYGSQFFENDLLSPIMPFYSHLGTFLNKPEMRDLITHRFSKRAILQEYYGDFTDFRRQIE